MSTEPAIFEGGRKRTATQRVRELECERNGHSYEAVLSYQSQDPQSFLCPNCSRSWRVVPDESIHLPALLSDQLGMSRSEARRIINQGGVKLDGEAVVDFDPPAERISGQTLKVGKEREVRVP